MTLFPSLPFSFPPFLFYPLFGCCSSRPLNMQPPPAKSPSPLHATSPVVLLSPAHSPLLSNISTTSSEKSSLTSLPSPRNFPKNSHGVLGLFLLCVQWGLAGGSVQYHLLGTQVYSRLISILASIITLVLKLPPRNGTHHFCLHLIDQNKSQGQA